MEAVTTLLSLVSKTQGRDKVLRLFQYLCLHAVDHQVKGARFKVYEQMRMTRKMLRFLRTLQYVFKIKAEMPELQKNINSWPMLLRHFTSILQNTFTLLFFLADHFVCLSQLGIISSEKHAKYYKLSMIFYIVQNICGILNNISCIIVTLTNQKISEQLQKIARAIKLYSFDLIRCVLDCFVGLYLLRKSFPAKIAGVLGVISSIMSIMQTLDKL